MNTPGAILLYRATCAKCRILSLVVVWLSLKWVERVPISSPRANALYEAHDLQPGKLALIGYQRIFLGWHVFPGLAALTMFAIRYRISKKHGSDCVKT
jgi:hypothetical protein